MVTSAKTKNFFSFIRNIILLKKLFPSKPEKNFLTGKKPRIPEKKWEKFFFTGRKIRQKKIRKRKLMHWEKFFGKENAVQKGKNFVTRQKFASQRKIAKVTDNRFAHILVKLPARSVLPGHGKKQSKKPARSFWQIDTNREDFKKFCWQLLAKQTIINGGANNYCMNLKQAMVIRNDLKMGKGKIAAQCAHASLEAYEKTLKQAPLWAEEWKATGQAKIVLKVNSKKELLELFEKTRKKIPASLVKDAGRTQVEAGEPTCIGIGPCPEAEINMFTKDLKLL